MSIDGQVLNHQKFHIFLHFKSIEKFIKIIIGSKNGSLIVVVFDIYSNFGIWINGMYIRTIFILFKINLHILREKKQLLVIANQKIKITIHVDVVIERDFHCSCGVLSSARLTCSMVSADFHYYVRSLPLKWIGKLVNFRFLSNFV